MIFRKSESSNSGQCNRRARRIALLGVWGSLTIFLACLYIDLFLARPVGSGPAGPPVDRGQFVSVWSDRKVALLGIGDSITAGLGASRSDKSYYKLLAHNSHDDWDAIQGVCLAAVLPDLHEVNIAVSGSTSIQHAASIKHRLSPFDQDVFGIVVLSTGGNDIIHNYGHTPPREGAMYGATVQQANLWVDRFRIRLDQMLTDIKALFPGGHEVYLANIYDPTDGVGDAPSVFLPPWSDGLRIHALYNAAIRSAANEYSHVHLVDLHAAFLGHGAHCRQFWRPHYDSNDPHYWFYYNVEDPNDRGHDAIRRIMLNTILERSALCQ